MIDIYAVVFIVGCLTVIGVVLAATLWLRSEMFKMESRLRSHMTEIGSGMRSGMTGMEARPGSDTTEMKPDTTEMESRIIAKLSEMRADIKTMDNSLRAVDRNVARTRGFLQGRLPRFKQETEAPASEASAQE